MLKMTFKLEFRLVIGIHFYSYFDTLTILGKTLLSGNSIKTIKK